VPWPDDGPVRRRQLLVATAGAVVAACAPQFGPARSSPAPTALPALAANPAAGRWPSVITRSPTEVREAYEFAARNEPTLRYIPCYCGCGAHGDGDNFDCYVNEIRAGGWLVLDDHALT